MFPNNYFPKTYYTGNYFPPTDSAPPVVIVLGLGGSDLTLRFGTDTLTLPYTLSQRTA